MSESKDENASAILAAIGALRRRDWKFLRRWLIGLLVSALIFLFQDRSHLGSFQVPVFAIATAIVIGLVLVEVFARPRLPMGMKESVPSATIRGLLPFGEDDAAAFASLGRMPDVSRVVNSILDQQFRFGTLYAESGCGKTSLLLAGVLPELKKRGYVYYLDDINNQEDPLHLVRRLLCRGVPSSGTQSRNVGEQSPGGAWLERFDTEPRPIFLILDQFEQFFLHYGQRDKQEPFLSFLDEWWTRHPASQLRILISLREDYLGKFALIQERLIYAQTVNNHLRLRKFPPDDAVEILRSMAAENGLEFHETAVRKACQSDLASREDGNISPVDLQILATGVRDLAASVKGFTADGLRSSGGLEGALERYLLAQLSNVPADRNAALAILRLLSELQQNVLAGFLSTEEILDRVGKEYGSERVRRMVTWLADSRVRLIVEKETPDGRRYRLVHDRLVSAVRKVSGQVLEAAERANVLLDQRVSEYLANQRSRRFLLPWSEWRFIRRHEALITWGSREVEKRELFLRSRNLVRTWTIGGVALTTLFLCGWAVWEFEPNVLIWRTQHEIAFDASRISDTRALSNIATALARASEKAKDSKLLEQAVAVAGKIDDPQAKASVLRAIATGLVRAGENDKTSRLLEQTVAVAGKIDHPQAKASALGAIAIGLARAGEKAKDSKLLEQAVAVAGKIDHPHLEAPVLRDIATGLARAGEKDKDSKLLEQAVAVAGKIDDPQFKAFVLREVAAGLATSGEKDKASKVLEQAVTAAERIDHPQVKPSALGSIATALARAGEKDKDSKLLEQAVAVAGKIDNPHLKAAVLGSIATALARVGEKEKASKLLEQAVMVAGKIDSPQAKASALSELAATLATTGEKDKASKLLEQAVTVAGRIDDPQVRASVLGSIATRLASTGEKDKDSKLLEQAVMVAGKIDHPQAKAAALREIATALAIAGEEDKASNLLEQAVTVAAKIDHPQAKAFVLRDIATGLARAGEKDKDSKLLEQAVAVTGKIDDPQLKVAALRDIATGLARAGEKDKDSKLLEQAVTVAGKIDHPEAKAYVLREIATGLARAGEKDKDSKLLEQAVTVAGKIDDPQVKASVLREIATALATTGEKDKASKLLEQAVMVAGKIDHPQVKASVLRDIATTLATTGEKDKASKLLEQAVTVAGRIDDPQVRASVLREIATGLARAGEKDKDSKLLEQAVTVTGKIDDPQAKAFALREIATGLARAGEKDKASNLMEQSEDLARGIPGTNGYRALTDVAKVHGTLGDIRRARQVVQDLPLPERTVAFAAILEGWSEEYSVAAKLQTEQRSVQGSH